MDELVGLMGALVLEVEPEDVGDDGVSCGADGEVEAADVEEDLGNLADLVTDPTPPSSLLLTKSFRARWDMGQVGATWDATFWAHMAGDADMACVLLMDRWLEDVTALFFSDTIEFREDAETGRVLTPCLKECDDWLRRCWLEEDHKLTDGPWLGISFTAVQIASFAFYLEGKLNPYRCPLCPEHRCAKCDGFREYVDKREDGTIPPDRLGQRVVMTHKLIHSLGGGPTFSRMMPVSILTTTHSVQNNDGSTTTIATPCFPGFTPGVRPRIISVFAPRPDSSPRTVDAPRARGGKQKWGKGHKHAPDIRPSEQDIPCSMQQPLSAGPPKRRKRTRKGR
jgi:hypothetical protein